MTPHLLMTQDTKITHIACHDLCVSYIPSPKNTPFANVVSKHISFEVQAGEILAIMGPSGSGKSTLLRGLLGRAPIITGQIWINGQDCSDRGGLGVVSHRVGLVPQADVLVDELSMRENIEFFHTITVDSGLTTNEVRKRAEQELAAIGLKDDPSKDKNAQLTRKRVGDGSGRKSNISGGQAKRANIAMELVNDPDVLIIDEPTSGLSSHDSLELIKKLKEIALRGKIVIVIIHQPSSEVFQLFDRLLLLDGGGHCVRSGTRDAVVEWLHGYSPQSFHCQHCATSFPDKVMEIIETRKNPGPDGKPRYWSQESKAFTAAFTPSVTGQKTALPDRPLIRPLQAWGDLSALFKRNLLVKRRDRFSMLLTYIAPPLLGWLFAAVFSASPPNSDYAFHFNGLFPQLVFMLIVCTLFLGMASSAVEVIKDRPMLEREASRGLRMWAYFATKFAAIMVFGSIQVLLLVLAATIALDASHLFGALFATMWLVMAMAVAMGLLISVFSSTATKAFNLIPLVLLPQIVLGGALLPYSDMGSALYLWEDKQEGHRPLVAALMPSSWAHQLTMRAVYQASQNKGELLNIAVADMRHIPADGFMSLRNSHKLDPQLLPEGRATPEWLSNLPDEPYALDAVVLIAITLGTLILGWAWVGKPYRLGTASRLKRTGLTTLVLVGLPLGVASMTVHHPVNTSKDSPGINFRLSPRPMAWSASLEHCAGLKAKMATLEQFLAVYDQHAKDFSVGDYWVLTTPQKNPRPTPVLISIAKLAALPDSQQTDAKAVMASKGVVKSSKVNPLQNQRFICMLRE